MNRLFGGTVCFLAILMVYMVPSTVARTVTVGVGGDHDRLEEAAMVARPGDTLQLLPGTREQRVNISELHGAQDDWIVIRGNREGSVRFLGGTEALHLSQVSWLRLELLHFEGQSANGVNIDDGGSFNTPSHNVVIDRCTFTRMVGTGNNDLLKLSGLDTFQISRCAFLDGAAGGSGVDMVGCHVGLITENRFERMGSNGIQAKGGTQYIEISRNRFVECGERSVNLGGSTGLAFFRPQNAPFEAADLLVQSNLFIGSRAPIAYVGSVRVRVEQNTIWRPGNWVVRILQESVDPARFLGVGDAQFINNLVVLDSDLSRLVNIGPDTRPESFEFAGNYFFHLDDRSWQISGLPGQLRNNHTGSDPLLQDSITFRPNPESPVIGLGEELTDPLRDFFGKEFRLFPSIGAVEGNPGGAGSDVREVRPQTRRLDLAASSGSFSDVKGSR